MSLRKAVGEDVIDRCPFTTRDIAVTAAGARHTAARGGSSRGRSFFAALQVQRRSSCLLLFAWLPFLVRAVQLYLAANFQQASLLAATAQTFRDFLDQQSLFVFFVTICARRG